MREKIYQMLESDKKSGVCYDRFMLVCIVCSIIPLCFKETTPLFIWIDRVTVAVFIADYLLRWITADMKYQAKKGIAFLRYPFSFFAIVDLLSILPSLTVLNSGFKLFRLFRLNKAFKALRLLRYSKSFNLILSVIKREKKGLLAVCVLAGGYIMLSALIMFQVEPDSFETFFDAVYWAVVTLTTVGYGDIYPTSDIGRVVSMLSSFMGIAIVALPTGIITAGYMNELNKDK
ncbi:MAG: ion transporter [Clostridia bacterium]|nr:ion transporter [Clostridia bacterium]